MRDMRRNERQLSDDTVKKILEKENWGVLSVHGDDNFPYGVPVNYAYMGGTLYIHCSSAASHKLDGIRRCNNVCFTVVSQHELHAPALACNYESVIVFGIATIIDSPEEKSEAMRLFMRGLAPEMEETGLQKCNPETSGLSIIKIEPVHLTGKRGQ